MQLRISTKWILTGAVVLAAVLASTTIARKGAWTARCDVPERALDMWGVEHEPASDGWKLFDFVHVAGCGYCVLNAAAYQRNFGDALATAGVRTFGVDVYETQRDLVEYVKHHDIRFPILTEPDALWASLRCPGLPGQSLFRGTTLVWSASATLTFRNFDRIRRTLGLSRPFAPAGPLKKALNGIYEDDHALLVLGDGLEADARFYIPGLHTVTFGVKHARDIADADLASGSVYAIGSLAENSFLKRLRGRIPFDIDDERIAFADTALTGDDLLLWFCYPNPWNSERYLVVKTGTATSSMEDHLYDGSQDFTIARRRGDVTVPVATGIFDKSDDDWTLSRGDIVWTRDVEVTASEVVACGPRGCEAPKPSGSVVRDLTREDGALLPASPAVRADVEWSTAGRFVALSAADSGECWAAWDRPGQGILAGPVNGDGCTPLQLSAGDHSLPRSVDAFKPTVLAESSERAWLAWSERSQVAYAVYAARVRAGGASEVWRISHHPNLDHHGPALAPGGDGRVWLAWYAWQANARIPYARAWNGNKWTAAAAVPTADDSRFAWYLTGSGAGQHARFAWMQHYPDPTGIVTATAATKAWSEPHVIARSGRYPSITYDTIRNETRVVWQQLEWERSSNDRYAWSIMTAVERGGRWSDPVALPRCPDGRNETPVVCVDGTGATWVFWAHKARAHEGAVTRWRIVCEVFDGETWHGPITISDPGVDARSPAATASDAVWVGWHEGAGERLDVRVKRIRPWHEAGGTTVGTIWTTREATKSS